jgi:hypothetical protein
MTTTFKEDKKAAADAALIQQSTAVYRKWLATKHPKIRDCEAVVLAFQRYMDFTDPLNEDDFEFALGNNPSIREYGKQHVPTKNELVEDICELLRAPDPSGRGGRYSSFNVESVRAKMQSWSLTQLQARKDEIIRAQALNEKPLSELKTMVHDAQPQFGFPKLPRSFVDGMKAVPIDAAFLKRLPSWELKKYVRIYGEFAINVRLAGE